MRRFWKQLHFWLAVPFGIFFTILCLTGALLVFEKEITAVVYKVAPDKVELSKFTGSPKIPIYRDIRDLHRYLLDKPAKYGEQSTGKMIVGVTTLASFFMLISGIIIWAPRTLKGLSRRLKVKTTSGRRRFWTDVHISLGFYSAIFLLIMAVTGLTWSFRWYGNAFYSLFGDESYRTHTEVLSPSAHRAEVRKGEQMPGTPSLRAAVKHVHTGTFGGPVTKTVWFLSALIGAALAPTGYYMYRKSLKTRDRSTRRRVEKSSRYAV